MCKNNYVDIGWNVSNCVKVLFTTRNFFSQKDFNISYLNDDYKKIFLNRKKLVETILPNNPNFIKQIHGNKVINLDKKNINPYTADGLITTKKNNVISVLTADCMPIVISSVCGSIICILHVGRKGLMYNIIEKAIKILATYNYTYEAWIGPSVSKNYYQVDKNIREKFISIDNNYQKFFFGLNNNKFNMDIKGIACFQLNSNNIRNIYSSEYCTVTHNDLFYSYRKSKDIQRFGTFVWIS